MIFLLFIFTHWVADFVCQTHWMASNKSKSWTALSAHVATYSLIITLAYVIINGTIAELHPGSIIPGTIALAFTPAFFVVTFASHFITDAITSRITSRLFAKQDWHNFFVVVGLDQFVHYATIYATLVWLGIPLIA